MSVAVPRESPEYRALRRIERLLARLVVDEYDADPGLLDYVRRRVAGAEEILRRGLVVSVRRLGEQSWIASFISLRAGKELGPRRILLRSLEGRIVEVEEGLSLDDMIHYAEVSPQVIKCTCMDSIVTASAASRLGTRTRSTLCKHVIALLAIITSGAGEDIGVYRKPLREALEAAYARLHGRPRRGSNLKVPPRSNPYR
ncbi:MAG: hypothetical protein GSR80_001426 [Desulfurococcales archaeon]|nr:hypothetical protein [Desulfurococcales archaeon]